MARRREGFAAAWLQTVQVELFDRLFCTSADGVHVARWTCMIGRAPQYCQCQRASRKRCTHQGRSPSETLTWDMAKMEFCERAPSLRVLSAAAHARNGFLSGATERQLYRDETTTYYHICMYLCTVGIEAWGMETDGSCVCGYQDRPLREVWPSSVAYQSPLEPTRPQVSRSTVPHASRPNTAIERDATMRLPAG